MGLVEIAEGGIAQNRRCLYRCDEGVAHQIVKEFFKPVARIAEIAADAEYRAVAHAGEIWRLPWVVAVEIEDQIVADRSLQR